MEILSDTCGLLRWVSCPALSLTDTHVHDGVLYSNEAARFIFSYMDFFIENKELMLKGPLFPSANANSVIFLLN